MEDVFLPHQNKFKSSLIISCLLKSKLSRSRQKPRACPPPPKLWWQGKTGRNLEQDWILVHIGATPADGKYIMISLQY